MNAHVAKFVKPPVPASEANIPDWYRSIPKYAHNGTEFLNYGGNQNNLTVKSCLPIVDTFTAGYIVSLPFDLQIKRDPNGNAIITWAFTVSGIHEPINRQDFSNCGWKSLDGYDELQFNWMPYWCIKTPKGYSSQIIHPTNRIDLPFYTLGGVVDTDGWGEVGNHPFLLKKNCEGILPSGTPIMQIIPFKRENWSAKVDVDNEDYLIKIGQRDSKLKDYYKTTHWNKKSYK